jgi:hypothetical protein
MLRKVLTFVPVCCVLITASLFARAETPAAKSRKFEFTYECTLQGLAPKQHYRLWVPIPQSGHHQTVSLVYRRNTNTGKVTEETKHGNKMLYIEGPANSLGAAECIAVYTVDRQEVSGPGSIPGKSEIEMYLQAEKLVPVGGKALSLIEGKQLPKERTELGRSLYDAVNKHMKYSKEGTGWGRGDSNWACDSKFGNCSDFHSLFISLARAQNMPAKFEIGFPLPDVRGSGEIGGYHCWAYFQPEPDKGWVPVDISEANKHPKMTDYYYGNLTESRVTFTTGRDLVLNPPQEGPPLNFFIYPYAEVDGKPWPADKIKKSFKYKDLN